MTISELRRLPLPDDIVNKLLLANEAYAEMHTLSQVYPEAYRLSSEILSVWDGYYYAWSLGGKDDIDTIILAAYSGAQNSLTDRFLASYKASKIYAHEKIAETRFLTAIDLIKINNATRDTDCIELSGEDGAYDGLPCIESFWLILNDLYNPRQQYHILLEAAVAVSRFLSLPQEETLNMPALGILLSLVYKGESAFDGLISQWTLSTDPRIIFSDIMDQKSTLLHVIDIFEKTWRCRSLLIHSMVDVKDKIYQHLQIACPALATAQMTQLISNNICIRINNFKSEMSISSKTAIHYLKLLERAGILSSVKIGRDRFYFNENYCELIRKMA